MSKENGRLVKCDRCGVTVFLKCIGENDLDGGWAKLPEFEHLPEGWEYCTPVGDLCPECVTKWHQLLTNFMEEGKKK